MEVCNYLIIPTTPERGVGLNPKVVHVGNEINKKNN